jgi:hypothetical protein
MDRVAPLWILELMCTGELERKFEKDGKMIHISSQLGLNCFVCSRRLGATFHVLVHKVGGQSARGGCHSVLPP